MNNRITSPFCLAATLALVLSLAGCGSGSTSLPKLTTGSLFGGPSKPKKSAAPKLPTATDRAIHLGAVSARASKCGYNFDPVKLRQDYLAFETRTLGAGDGLVKATEAYDKTNILVAKAIANNETYCSRTQTKKIKADLTRALAGDFSAPVKKKKNTVSFWDSGDQGREVINWEGVFDPSSNADKTKRVPVDQ